MSAHRHRIVRLSLALLCLPAAMAHAAVNDADCQGLSSMRVRGGTITATEAVGAGGFIPPSANNSRNQPPQFRDLPAFCRVSLNLTPSRDSDINVEVWLPLDWNGKYLAVGNGAFLGSIAYPALATALSRGYATSSTDTGHTGNTALFGLGHPEKVVDFGWRAVHEMTVTSKAVISTFYSQAARYAYWNGCSAGGRQAMKEAQRFPLDFDGIIAGAPGLDWTGRAVAALRLAQHLNNSPDARLDQPQRELVAAATLNACDADDGVTDGVIGKPAQCQFDPSILACSADARGACLNPEQVATVKMLYESPVNPATGRAITGLLPGSELGWTDLGWTGSARATGLDQLRYLVYEDENWSVDDFDFDADAAKAERADRDTLNALDPDLGDFFSAGGKLIQYHGWSDPQISPANSTQYYDRVTEKLGGRDKVHDSYRLFMAPGMAHCGGGNGPNTFDMITALEEWVEQDQAPTRIVATHDDGGQQTQRPLCPYPEEAAYRGRGDTNNADNFVCRIPE